MKDLNIIADSKTVFEVKQQTEIPHVEKVFHVIHDKIRGYFFQVIVGNEMGWEHVSVTIWKVESKNKIKPVERTPTWAEMSYIKDLFWNDEEVVVQYHPAKSEYVNMVQNCLHLWRYNPDQEFLIACRNTKEAFERIRLSATIDPVQDEAVVHLLRMYDEMTSRLSELMPNPFTNADIRESEETL